jgi:hypothetical protein
MCATGLSVSRSPQPAKLKRSPFRGSVFGTPDMINDRKRQLIELSFIVFAFMVALASYDLAKAAQRRVFA